MSDLALRGIGEAVEGLFKCGDDSVFVDIDRIAKQFDIFVFRILFLVTVPVLC